MERNLGMIYLCFGLGVKARRDHAKRSRRTCNNKYHPQLAGGFQLNNAYLRQLVSC